MYLNIQRTGTIVCKNLYNPRICTPWLFYLDLSFTRKVSKWLELSFNVQIAKALLCPGEESNFWKKARSFEKQVGFAHKNKDASAVLICFSTEKKMLHGHATWRYFFLAILHEQEYFVLLCLSSEHIIPMRKNDTYLTHFQISKLNPRIFTENLLFLYWFCRSGISNIWLNPAYGAVPFGPLGYSKLGGGGGCLQGSTYSRIWGPCASMDMDIGSRERIGREGRTVQI